MFSFFKIDAEINLKDNFILTDFVKNIEFKLDELKIKIFSMSLVLKCQLTKNSSKSSLKFLYSDYCELF